MTMPQTTVNIWSALGVPGDVAFDGPMRAAPYNLYSGACSNVIGYAYTVVNGGNPEPSANSANAGTAQVGGAGVFAGILINSKEYAAYATCSSHVPLDPTMILPNYAIGDLMTMGTLCVQLDGAANVGASVYYAPATGALSVTSSGHTLVPNATVVRYDLSGSGLAIIQLTN